MDDSQYRLTKRRFQGDENDHIVLSLVRYNKDNTLGFSAVPNRICVALSRARCGFYIIGQVSKSGITFSNL